MTNPVHFHPEGQIVCAFLVSSAASYMTGEIVYIDGGRMALNDTVTA